MNTRYLIILFSLIFFPFLFGQEIVVESDYVYYDGETILLKGAVSVENALGKVTAQEALLRRDLSKKSQIPFPWATLEGQVVVLLSNGGKLECQKIEIDHQLMTSFLSGNPQVIYTDQLGQVYADSAQIDYLEIEGSIRPTKITLLSHVQLINKGSSEKPTLQYALADCVFYFPEEQRMILECTEHPAVLFFDHTRNMQLSARRIDATRNPETGHEVIQGNGDVRFVFAPEEFERLKKQFHWEHS